MDTNSFIALASLLSGLGAATAAIVAAYALRTQQSGQRRQHDLENMRWISEQWDALREQRRAAARSLLNDKPDFASLRDVLNFLDTCGYLVRERIVSEKSLGHSMGLLGIRGWFHTSEAFIREQRSLAAGALFWDELEWLAGHLEHSTPDGPWLEHFLERQAAE
jgi:hypothetical protein